MSDTDRNDLYGYVVEFDGVCTEAALLDIMLQLTQGEGTRNINLKSQGKIAAAVLSVDGEFDATTIDPTTVTLGDGADPDAHVAGNNHGKLMVSWPDLNEDGLNDALFHAGLDSGSAFEWVDDPNGLHFYVVDLDTDVQIRRLMLRDQLTREQAEAALQSQAGRERRLAIADDVLDNSGLRSTMTARVKQLHARFLALAENLSGD